MCYISTKSTKFKIKNQYTEDNIRSLEKEHIRMRPGMYIGKLGDGSLLMMEFTFF
jgi:DNA gyrase/topoisomerase IV subunit B